MTRQDHRHQHGSDREDDSADQAGVGDRVGEGVVRRRHEGLGLAGTAGGARTCSVRDGQGAADGVLRDVARLRRKRARRRGASLSR